MGAALVVGLALLLSLLLALLAPPAWASGTVLHYFCDGEPLSAELNAGSVDAADIPNRSQGTAPGSYVLLTWRGVTLQLPRTNNAGVPSYSDGRWWWQLDDPASPAFAQRRAAIERYSCTPAAAANADA